jgi:hypothetical protein
MDKKISTPVQTFINELINPDLASRPQNSKELLKQVDKLQTSPSDFYTFYKIRQQLKLKTENFNQEQLAESRETRHRKADENRLMNRFLIKIIAFIQGNVFFKKIIAFFKKIIAFFKKIIAFFKKIIAFFKKIIAFIQGNVFFKKIIAFFKKIIAFIQGNVFFKALGGIIQFLFFGICWFVAVSIWCVLFVLFAWANAFALILIPCFCISIFALFSSTIFKYDLYAAFYSSNHFDNCLIGVLIFVSVVLAVYILVTFYKNKYTILKTILYMLASPLAWLNVFINTLMVFINTLMDNQQFRLGPHFCEHNLQVCNHCKPSEPKKIMKICNTIIKDNISYKECVYSYKGEWFYYIGDVKPGDILELTRPNDSSTSIYYEVVE